MSELESLWKKYREGRLNKEEKKELLTALENSEKADELDSFLKVEWMASNKVKLGTQVGHDRLYELIQNRISNKPLGAERRMDKWWKDYRYAVAVCLTILLLAGSIFTAYNNAESDFITLQVPAGGQVKSFTLPDGSKVWLNVATSLQYQKDFVEHRNIRLFGEAYFEVAKNRQSPFTVAFNEHKLVVTGTMFNIKAYGNEDSSSVNVEEGSVNVISEADTSSLVQNDRLLIENKGGKQYKSTKVFGEASKWKLGEMVFDHTPMEQVLKTLERQFDVTIAVEDVTKLKDSNLTTRYQANANLKEVLDGLAYLQNLEYRMYASDSVTIWKLDK
ncbi:FecR domain-containing protein [Limibacter armeniacum]|uniref:FecR family protein n=1 Tax=Limibacter armeniacum TaxID=466084 RepID=UPI002FE5C0A3